MVTDGPQAMHYIYKLGGVFKFKLVFSKFSGNRNRNEMTKKNTTTVKAELS